MTAVAALASPQEGREHLAEPRAELLDGVGVFLPRDADEGGEIHCADGFGQRVSGFDEVFVAHGSAFVGQTFAEAEKAALRRPGGLIAELAVADFGLVHASSELTRHAVGV